MAPKIQTDAVQQFSWCGLCTRSLESETQTGPSNLCFEKLRVITMHANVWEVLHLLPTPQTSDNDS